MQQWAMNRSRIEEEIMRRQESRRYASRSGEFIQQRVIQWSLQNWRSKRATEAAISRRGANFIAGWQCAIRGQKWAWNCYQCQGYSCAASRTAHSALAQNPYLDTVVVMLNTRARGGQGAGHEARIEAKVVLSTATMRKEEGGSCGSSGVFGCAASCWARWWGWREKEIGKGRCPRTLGEEGRFTTRNHEWQP